MTGPRFHGARIELATPQSKVEVTGTTLAVICEPQVTCVCVYEGTVMVQSFPQGSDRSVRVAVPAGQRRTLFSDSRPTEQAEMRPGERVALGRMSEAMRAALAGD